MLTPEVLISPILSLDALLIAGDNKSFNVYLQSKPGDYSVGLGSLPQKISALQLSAEWLNRIRTQLSYISTRLDLLFFEVSEPNIADISIFFDSEIDLGSNNSITYGVTAQYYPLPRDNG